MTDPNRETPEARKARNGLHCHGARPGRVLVILIFVISLKMVTMSAPISDPVVPQLTPARIGGRANARVALICTAVFVAMVGAAFAAWRADLQGFLPGHGLRRHGSPRRVRAHPGAGPTGHHPAPHQCA